MRIVLIIAVCFMCSQQFANATVLNCHWLKTSDLGQEFYRPAQLKIEIKDQYIIFHKDNFTSRLYEPCWIGDFSSCYFIFSHQRHEPWKITQISRSDAGTDLTIENSWHWTAKMTWSFDSRIDRLMVGDTALAQVSGDDGDGVVFNHYRFSCRTGNLEQSP